MYYAHTPNRKQKTKGPTWYSMTSSALTVKKPLKTLSYLGQAIFSAQSVGITRTEFGTKQLQRLRLSYRNIQEVVGVQQVVVKKLTVLQPK
jgi:hypothetical protein